jgi:hypothetical protein
MREPVGRHIGMHPAEEILACGRGEEDGELALQELLVRRPEEAPPDRPLGAVAIGACPRGAGRSVRGEPCDQPQAFELLRDAGAVVMPQRAQVAAGGGDQLCGGERCGDL